MKLTKVETHGFKSFADKTMLKFDGGIVGIVGPNGSGKSNINDAIKWVLGEMSAKSLRGDSMQDIIFAGSKTVAALNKAEVSLTFDNSDRSVSIDVDELTITRVLTRSGNSTYYINDEVARLKDIKEIAMESGMSKSSLAIISQGTVQDIAQASPEERRLIFEEAAGVSKYKSRKLEAMRKLDKTSESLEKIQAVAQELNRQLKPLERQATKAMKYLELKDSLKNVEISLIVEDVKFYAEALQKLNSELEGVISSKEDIESRLKETNNTLITKQNAKSKIESEIHKLDNQLDTLVEDISKLQGRNSEAAQKRKLIIDGNIQINSAAKEEALKEELEDLSAKIHSFKNHIETLQKEIDETKEKTQTINKTLSSKRNELNGKNNLFMKMSAKLNFLNNQKNNKGNLHRGVKTILNNISAFPGLHGIVADLLTVEKDYRVAVETAIKGIMQNVVVEDTKVAIRAIEFLKSNSAGRATFMPLDKINPNSIPLEYVQVANKQPGFVGIGSNLVKVDPRFEILKRNLLGKVIVVDKIYSAERMSLLFESKYMVVTMDGDIIRPGGILSGGSQQPFSSLLGIDDEIESISKSIPAYEEDVSKLRQEIEEQQVVLDGEQSTIAQNNLELAKVSEKVNFYEDNYNLMKVEYESISNKKFEDNVKEEHETYKFESLQNEKNNIKSTIKTKRETLFSLNQQINEANNIKSGLDSSLLEIMNSSSDKMTERNKAEFIVDSSKKRLSEEYQMTIESAIEVPPLDIDIDEAREIVSSIRVEIQELGNVNLDSIEDYKEVEKRYTKITESEKELFEAKEIILKAIKKMDSIIVSKIDETFNNVNKEMNTIFQVMFGGGFAEIKYTDPKNKLESGIEVVAQPPGKTVKNLKLFSGGEKAIVAITLLFSILKSKPLPLCILDEVEAALDDANVIRYANYLKELKENTQFIVVTHRVGTMSRVDHLFGATMQKRGVTSFFSVKLEAAKELIEN